MMKKNNQHPTYNTTQIIFLTILQVLIGWHFLFEGLMKLHSHAWSSREFLLGSTGPLSSIFRYLANSDSLIPFMDQLNIWGLILIGFCLFTGLFSKPSKVAGIVLLALYYLANPPFSTGLSASAEGNYWIVNRNLIEMAALLVLYFVNPSHISGLDRYLRSKSSEKIHISEVQVRESIK
jgi:thiosulfate dehydrogenase [quinone] large subunit